MATISFAITVHNEHKELDKLLQQLTKSIREEDEIVVQMDITATEEVKAVVNNYKLTNYFHPLNKDFAAFKNNLKSLCTKDWIFFIDADETLNYYFSKNIHEFLELNKGIVDLIAVPRVNKVNGLTQSHIDKWRWFVDDNNWINYPDYQTRICSNKPEINWVNKVHEHLSGWKTIANFPHGYDLIHPKTIERQERQNNFYDTL